MSMNWASQEIVIDTLCEKISMQESQLIDYQRSLQYALGLICTCVNADDLKRHMENPVGLDKNDSVSDILRIEYDDAKKRTS